MITPITEMIQSSWLLPFTGLVAFLLAVLSLYAGL
jgi:hypothetical protein